MAGVTPTQSRKANGAALGKLLSQQGIRHLAACPRHWTLQAQRSSASAVWSLGREGTEIDPMALATTRSQVGGCIFLRLDYILDAPAPSASSAPTICSTQRVCLQSILRFCCSVLFSSHAVQNRLTICGNPRRWSTLSQSSKRVHALGTRMTNGLFSTRPRTVHLLSGLMTSKTSSAAPLSRFIDPIK